MVEKTAENAYISHVMSRLPEVKKGEARKINRGDCLWNIAKSELNKTKKASNQEISEYMLLIAKLNGLDTKEKMDALKVDQLIYIPESAGASELKNEKVKPPETAAERSFNTTVETVLNDKTISVEKASYVSPGSTLYHVFQMKPYSTGFGPAKQPVMSFNLDKNGHVSGISFKNDKENVNVYGYDYDIGKDGKILYHEYPHRLEGQADQAQLQQLEQKLLELIPNK